MIVNVNASVEVDMYLIYGYRFESKNEFNKFLVHLINNRIPDENSNLTLFNLSTEMLMNYYLKEHYNAYLNYLNSYYNDLSIEVYEINGEECFFVLPRCCDTYISLFDSNTDTNISKITTGVSVNTEPIRNYIYFMESNGYDYIANKMSWHITYTTRQWDSDH